MRITKPTPAHALLTIAALALSLALIPAALAKGKPGGSGSVSSTISAPVMVADANGDGLPNWNDTVTFNVSTTATAQPYVHVTCSGVAYDSWRGFFAGSLDSNWNFVLSSGGWTSGAADCTASLGMYTKQGFKQLSSASFHVDA
jgi:hypothetical protein